MKELLFRDLTLFIKMEFLKLSQDATLNFFVKTVHLSCKILKNKSIDNIDLNDMLCYLKLEGNHFQPSFKCVYRL